MWQPSAEHAFSKPEIAPLNVSLYKVTKIYKMSKWFVKLHLCIFECNVAFLKCDHETQKKKVWRLACAFQWCEFSTFKHVLVIWRNLWQCFVNLQICTFKSKFGNIKCRRRIFNFLTKTTMSCTFSRVQIWHLQCKIQFDIGVHAFRQFSMKIISSV